MLVRVGLTDPCVLGPGDGFASHGRIVRHVVGDIAGCSEERKWGKIVPQTKKCAHALQNCRFKIQIGIDDRQDPLGGLFLTCDFFLFATDLYFIAVSTL